MLLRTIIGICSLITIAGCTDAPKNAAEVSAANSPSTVTTESEPMKIFQGINAVFNEAEASSDHITTEHKESLTQLADFISAAHQRGDTAQLVFICTHNSRRSHLAAIWAQTAAFHHGIDKVSTYSGGTEATAFNPRAVAALERDGFKVEYGEGDNPVYQVAFSDAQLPLSCFSKVYDHASNPQGDFCAVMVCSDADEGCPIVRGAAERISLPYIDPKVSDGTPQEDSTYTARSHQIAREMYWVMQQVKNKH